MMSCPFPISIDALTKPITFSAVAMENSPLAFAKGTSLLSRYKFVKSYVTHSKRLGKMQMQCLHQEMAGNKERPWKTSDARLVLEDGFVWRAKSVGASGTQVGEVVFNTSLTGYQEILTDPSYAGQFVLMTNPHIENTGVNPDDEESSQCFLLVWSSKI